MKLQEEMIGAIYCSKIKLEYVIANPLPAAIGRPGQLHPEYKRRPNVTKWCRENIDNFWYVDIDANCFKYYFTTTEDKLLFDLTWL